MRSLLTLVAVLLLALPAVAAKVADDAAGDVQAGVAGAPLGADPTPLHACVDLRALDVSESEDEFLFTLTVEDLSDPPQESPDGCAYAVLFSHNGREFQLFSTRNQSPLSDEPYASLGYRDDPGSSWRRVWDTDRGAEWDTSADTLSITIPRDELADAAGVAPHAGSTLAALHVNSASFLSGGDASNGVSPMPVVLPAWAADRMPDGDANAEYAVQSGAPPESADPAPGRQSADRPGSTVMAEDEGDAAVNGPPAKDAPAPGTPLWLVALTLLAVGLRRRQ
ncbi:MAG: hypothetical protein ACYC2H_04360 [Thermoplasmatota archaeon]